MILMALMRTFTLQEATAALGQVRPLAERMVAARRAELAAREQRAALAARIGSNGGDLTPSDVAGAAEAVERAHAELVACVEAVQELGVQVKDLDEGLVDFPSLRDGELVLLCWKVGEEAIEHWHGVDEGFAGRKPL